MDIFSTSVCSPWVDRRATGPWAAGKLNRETLKHPVPGVARMTLIHDTIDSPQAPGTELRRSVLNIRLSILSELVYPRSECNPSLCFAVHRSVL